MVEKREDDNLSSQNTRDGRKAKEFINALLKQADDWIWGIRFKKGKSQSFPFAFQVTEANIIKINKRILALFDKFNGISQEDVFFMGNVRFQDISTNSFSKLDDLLDKAGDKKDPEKLVLRWHSFIKEYSSSAEIIIEFTTEKPLLNEDVGALKYNIAWMKLSAYSPVEDWNELAFDELMPFVNSLKLGGMYKPLLVFRNKYIVGLVSYGIGAVVWATYNQIQTLSKDVTRDITDAQAVNAILAKSDINGKFEEFIKLYYSHKPSSPIIDTIYSVGLGLILFYISIVMSDALLPKLVPKSGINIGLSKSRYDSWENAFKLIVFTFLIGGFLLPLIRKIFGI